MEQETTESRARNAQIVARLERYRQTDSGIVPNAQSNKSEQESELKQYAQENNIWFDEKNIADNSARKFPSGKEADVYVNVNGKTVTKVVNYSKYSETPLDFLDNRILLFNQLFNDTEYTIVGFTETNKGFSFVIEQPYIKGKELSRLTTSMQSMEEQQQRVKDYIKTRFGLDESGLDAFGNNELTIEDLHLRNVIEGDDGNLYVIDAVTKKKLRL